MNAQSIVPHERHPDNFPQGVKILVARTRSGTGPPAHFQVRVLALEEALRGGIWCRRGACSYDANHAAFQPQDCRQDQQAPPQDLWSSHLDHGATLAVQDCPRKCRGECLAPLSAKSSVPGKN